MSRHNLSFLVLTIVMLAAGSADAAVAVVLDCTSDSQKSTFPGMHALYDADYDAGTVREHYIDDDGAPFTFNGRPMSDLTSRAQVSDTEIKWTEQMAAGPSYYTLGRYSGTLTIEMHFGSNNSTSQTPCRPWTSNNRQRQF